MLLLKPRKLADFLGDFHRAEFGAAHRAEVGGLGAFGRKRLVVILLRRFGIEREDELVAPAELEAGLRQRIVPLLRRRVALGQVSRVGG